MKNVIRIGIALVVSMLFVQCKQELKQNIIKCEIEGLQKGDKIILSLGNLKVHTSERLDSIIYEGQQSLLLKTTEKDVMANITVVQKSNEVDIPVTGTTRIFFEGYANLVVKGTAKYFRFADFSGGLYELPEMKKIEKIKDKFWAYQKKAFELLSEFKSDTITKQRRDVLGEQMFLYFGKANKLSSDSIAPLEKQFVKNNPDVSYSAELLYYDYDLKDGKDFSKYEDAFMQLSERVRNTQTGKRVARYIEARKTIEEGHSAPNFTIRDIEGKEISLSDYRGKFVLLEFWGTWCGGCRKAIPYLKKLRKKISKDKMVMLSIACEEPSEEKWKEFIKKEKVEWLQALEKGKKIQKMYAIQAYPTFFLISPKGKILKRSVGLQQKIIDKVKEIGK